MTFDVTRMYGQIMYVAQRFDMFSIMFQHCTKCRTINISGNMSNIVKKITIFISRDISPMSTIKFPWKSHAFSSR